MRLTISCADSGPGNRALIVDLLSFSSLTQLRSHLNSRYIVETHTYNSQKQNNYINDYENNN